MLSGYKTITVIQLTNIVWALEETLIDHHAVRVYLASFVVIAIREAARRSQRKRRKEAKDLCRYRVNELERLTQLSAPAIRRALRRLREAGLLVFSEGEIVITKEPLLGSETFQVELACRRSSRRPIPVPRAMLRFLAQNRAEALTKVVVAYLVRGLSLARQGGEIKNKGTVKASWIADTFGLSRRAVKYAQATLRSLGWISKDTQSRQRKLNRDGAYFVINLGWALAGNAETARSVETSAPAIVKRDKSECRFALPPAEKCIAFAPPYEDKKTSYEDQNQKTQPAEPVVSGVCSGRRREELQQSTKMPTLRNILPSDLWHFGNLEQLYFQAVEQGWIDASEARALDFIAAAVKAREVGREPVRLFVALVRGGMWSHLTQAQEEHARRALARFRQEDPERFRPPPKRVPATVTSCGSELRLPDFAAQCRVRLRQSSRWPGRVRWKPSCDSANRPGAVTS